jgi:hypothetical protein
MNLVFSSKAMKDTRPALEELLFFNPRQYRVREGIVNSLERFGHPRLEETKDGLSVRVGEQEAQTLFVYDHDSHDDAPVGVVVFLRTSPEEIAILHVAVHDDYTLQGRHGDLGLGTILVEKVKEIASRVVGVRKIVFFYRQEVEIRL